MQSKPNNSVKNEKERKESCKKGGNVKLSQIEKLLNEKKLMKNI